MEGLICFFIVVALGTVGGVDTNLDRRIWLLRIHDHGVVRLHIARAFSGLPCSTASKILTNFWG